MLPYANYGLLTCSHGNLTINCSICAALKAEQDQEGTGDMKEVTAFEYELEPEIAAEAKFFQEGSPENEFTYSYTRRKSKGRGTASAT